MLDKETRIKLLIVGDPGTGKSSLVNYLKNYTNFKISNDPQNHSKIPVPHSTIGASVDVILFQSKIFSNSTFCLELWDISGTQKFKSTRHIFYNNLNGLVLVHDLSNSKSLDNLKCWQREVNSSSSLDSVETKNDLADHYNMESDSSQNRLLPLISIGMKKRQINPNKTLEVNRRTAKFSSEVRAIEVNVDIEENVDNFARHYGQKLDLFFENCVRHSKNHNANKYTSAMGAVSQNLDSTWRHRSGAVGVNIKMD